MKWYLGVDGGGSRTRVCLADATGRIHGQAEAGPTNLHHTSEREVRHHFEQALRGACDVAGVDRATCVSVFLGMAGVTSPETRDRFVAMAAACGLMEAKMGVDHDIRIALAGGLGGQPGIALIVGTGSSCYGRREDGQHWQTGGWGSLLADEGSGYWLGREALVAAVRMADGRLARTELQSRFFDYLGIQAISEVLYRVHEQGLSRPEIAALAPHVVELVSEGDGPAQAILDQGAEHLADMVAANHAHLPTGPGPDVVITGGLGTAAAVYRERIEAAIRKRLPTARIHRPLLSPVAGAAMLAMEQAGQPPTQTILDNLQGSAHELA